MTKKLKALVVKNTNRHSLPIHNLLKLAKDANVKLNDKLKQDLVLINEFNIRARYNDYKLKFYKKATKEYTTQWLNKSKEVFKWLKKELKKK